MYTSKNLAITVGLAAIIALCGCSATHESSTTVTTSVTSEDGTTETSTTEVSTSVGTDGISADASTTTDTIINVDSWEWGWIGTSSTGYPVFYAEAPTGDQAVLVIEEGEGDLLAFVGELTMDEDEISTVTDSANGMGFNFLLVGQDGETVTLDLGEDYGIVDLTPYEMPDFLAELAEIDINGQVIA